MRRAAIKARNTPRGIYARDELMPATHATRGT